METKSHSNYHHLLLVGLRDSFNRYKEIKKARDSLDPPNKADPEDAVKRMKMNEELESNRIGVILFGAGSLEAIINFYLTTNTSPSEFTALEKLSPVEKWTIGPKYFDKNYELDLGNSPGKELGELFRRRNAILHHTPYLEQNGDVLQRGKFPSTQGDESGMIEKFYELPVNLIRHVTSVQLKVVEHQLVRI